MGGSGFKELVAEVGLGEVGLVLALEVSRLARSSADWHQLLDLCALTGTLIADSDGIYSPADFNDRLLLGLKGTMSEAELHLIRARLDGGLRNKAQRGELELNLPVGLDRDDDGRIVLCADEQVRHAIERVFVLWRRHGSARQVVAWLIAEGQRLPRRTVGQRRVRWAARQLWRPCTTFSPTRRMRARSCSAARAATSALDEHGRVRRRTVELPIEQWSVCLPEHHPGYVSWDEYLATRERLRANVIRAGEGGGAAREGVALLQGIVRCGRCGRRMQVAYSGNGGRVPRYACVRAHQLHGTDSACQSLGGLRLEKAIAARVPGGRHPGRAARFRGSDRRARAPARRAPAGQRLAVERAEFEADRARRQFDACEPEHRLVARTLEAPPRTALTALERERREARRARHAPPRTADRRGAPGARAHRARPAATVGRPTTTTARDRKELLRTLIARSIVTVRDEPTPRRGRDRAGRAARAPSCACR